MKKLLFLILLCSSFVSCSSDDDENPQTGNPISNLGIPQSSNDSPIKSGESVTIKGEGFTQSSEIWLRSVIKSADTEVKAEVTSVTASGISFIAPAISGERNIILKQSGQEYTLGEMYFENSSETIVKKRIIKTDYWGYTTEFIYNEDGKVSCIKEYELSLTKGGGYNNESILTYNSEGLLIQVTEREAISKEILGEISFEYSDKYTVKVTDKQAKGEYTYTDYTTLTLNESGQLKDLKSENLQIKYEYDETGNVSKLTKIEFYSEMYHTITHTYKYDDKKSYLSNTGLPIWYWVYDYSNITKNSQYCYDGPNNITEHKSDDGGIYLFKYDYDDYDYPTAIYDADDNEKMSDFIYETIK